MTLKEIDAPILRRFDSAAINAAIEKALLEVPTDKKGAVVAYANDEGAGLAVMARLSEGWSLVGTLDRKWKGELEAEAQARWTW